MKNLKVTLAAIMIALISMLGTNKAQAQEITPEDVLVAAGNLVNVQIGSVNVQAIDVIDVSDVNIDITALNNILTGINIDNVLTSVLRDADIITDNQVVVGILSDQTAVYVVDKSILKTRRR